jgi:MFS family permease
MYTLIRENFRGAALPSVRRPAVRVRVAGTVILLGITSLLTDISSEMVAAILPLYLTVQLGLSPLYFGFIDGLYQFLSVPLRLAGGFLGDRTRRHKDVAASGYALSAFSKLGLLASGSISLGLTSFLIADRAGKGVRTAPRDALIAANATPQTMGLSFGVHRSLDTLGALIGPVLAFAILTMAPGAFDSIFVVSFCIALIGVAVIVLFVPGREARPAAEAPSDRVAMADVAKLFRRAPFVRLLLIAGGLGLFTVSDGFLYLVLQRQLDFEAGLFPLLYVGTAAVYFALAAPAGWLADRFGRGRVLVVGYLFLIATYTALLREPSGPIEITFYLLLFGAYYAATDGVLAALGSTRLPEQIRGTGLAMLASMTGIARFGGAIT